MATQKAGTAPAVSLVFDGLDRQTGQGTQAYSYDSLDRIVTQGTTAFAYAGLEIDPAKVGTTLLTHTPGGQLLATKTGTATATLTDLDNHGDVIALYNGAATVTGTRTYTPLGQPVATGGTYTTPVGFQGDYTDPTTADVWMGARWYRPNTGTFTNRDTNFGALSTPVSLNRYTYAWADPLGLYDPDGHCAADIGNSRERCVKHRIEIPKGSGGPGDKSGSPSSSADSDAAREVPLFRRTVSTNYFNNALTRDDQIVASQEATWWYYHCQGDWNACVDIAADTDLNDASARGVGLLMALDQLRLEVLVGKYEFVDHELFDDPDTKRLVPANDGVDGGLLDLAPTIASNIPRLAGGSLTVAGPAGSSCGSPCISYIPPDQWSGPYNQTTLRAFVGRGPPNFELHHVVSQNIGNITKFGLVEIHSPSNVRWLAPSEHQKITSWQNNMQLFPGISNNDFLSTMDWGDQATIGGLLIDQQMGGGGP